MSEEQARAVLSSVARGEAVPVASYVDALKVCLHAGYETVSDFLAFSSISNP